MARVRMVTRTIDQTTAEVMTLNVKTAEVSIKEYKIGGAYSDEELLKRLQEIFNTEELKLVHIETNKIEEVLLGMSEEDFIKHAKVLPPRNVVKDTE